MDEYGELPLAGVFPLILAALWAFGAWFFGSAAVPAGSGCSGQGLGVMKVIYWLGVPLGAYCAVQAVRRFRSERDVTVAVYSGAVLLVVVGVVFGRHLLTAGALSSECGV